MGNRTGRIAVLGALLSAGALCVASSAQAAKLVVGSASGDPGTQVTFTTTLQAEGAMVAGTQNDIGFDPTKIAVAPKASGKCSVTTTMACTADGSCPSGEVCLKGPDCAVNADISKGATSFAFRPNNCTGTACTSIRALVLATDNTDPIVDNSVLYTCKLNIAQGASGTFPLTASGVILSDPNGNQVAGATGVNGEVTAGAPPENTPTPTATGVPACNPPAIQGASVAATPGVVSVGFTLLSGNATVAGTQNDITFDVTNAPIAPKASGKCSVTKTMACTADGNCPSGEVCLKAPDCAVNPDIGKGATSFAFRPNNCTGTACTSVRALVLATDNVDPIPDQSVLFTCKVNFAATSSLGVTGVILSDPNGNQVPGASGCAGSVSTGGPSPTNTATPTAGGVTNTPTATATGTPTPQPGTSTLAQAAAVGATTLVLADASSFPAAGSVQVSGQVLAYTSKNGNILNLAAALTSALQQGAVVTLVTTPTATATLTRTVTPTNTRTPIVVPTNTPSGAPTAAPFDDDGGCNISATGHSNAGWLVLIPAIGLLVMRRRRR